MKKIFLLLAFGFAYIFMQAQTSAAGSWKIKWNKKIILETIKSDEAANTKKINAADLKKNIFSKFLIKKRMRKKKKNGNVPSCSLIEVITKY